MQEPDARFNTQSPILTINLQTPKLHEGLITRTALLEKLDQAVGFPLTLVTAPAGFGKTTLLAQWLSRSRNVSVQESAAWISLEKECDLRQFWTYIITALQAIEPALGQAALASLDSAEPSIHALLRILINEISEVTQDFVLILDDFQNMDDPGLYATFPFFIDHLPSNLHLVIASRSEPPLSLARRRASNDLYELHAEDLRFTTEEITAFFHEIKRLHLSPREVAALENRTEGWVAGLQLVALAIQGYEDRSKRSFISTFTGSQRYILDYLVEEVLQQQPDHLRSFLRHTSILERLSASLCNAVTGRTDGQSILESLERDHLFITPLDHAQRWYSYHPLFKDVLYHRLTRIEPESVLEMHRRAREWFTHEGRLEEAIRHACAAHEWDRAVELIEPAIKATWKRGEIRKIIGWLSRLPDEYLDSRRYLYLYSLRALLHGGQIQAAERRLQKAEADRRACLNPASNREDRLPLGTLYAGRTMLPMAAQLHPALAQDRMPDYTGRLLAGFPADETIASPTRQGAEPLPFESTQEQLVEPLSERELEVLQLLAGGASNQEIAEALTIAVTTAKKHVSNIIRKLGVENRTQAVTKGLNLGLCD